MGGKQELVTRRRINVRQLKSVLGASVGRILSELPLPWALLNSFLPSDLCPSHCSAGVEVNISCICEAGRLDPRPSLAFLLFDRTLRRKPYEYS